MARTRAWVPARSVGMNGRRRLRLHHSNWYSRWNSLVKWAHDVNWGTGTGKFGFNATTGLPTAMSFKSRIKSPPVVHSLNRTWFNSQIVEYYPDLWETDDAIQNYRYFNQSGEYASWFFDREGCCRGKGMLWKAMMTVGMTGMSSIR